MPDRMITIELKEYISLRRDAEILNALETGGVDNWDWYYESLKDNYVEPFPDEPGAREFD